MFALFVGVGRGCIDHALAQDEGRAAHDANHLPRITDETAIPIKVVVGVCVLSVGVSGMWLETRLAVKGLRRECIGIRDEVHNDICNVEKFVDVRFLEEWSDFDLWAAELATLNPAIKLPVRKRARINNLRSEP